MKEDSVKTGGCEANMTGSAAAAGRAFLSAAFGAFRKALRVFGTHPPALSSSLALALTSGSAFAQLELEWFNTYGEFNNEIDGDRIYNHTEVSDGGFVFTGRADNDSGSSLWLGKIDEDGELLWEHHHAFDKGDLYPRYDCGYTVIEDEDHGILVFGVYGYTFEYRGWPPNNNILVMKTNATGDSILWLKTFGGEGWDDGYKAIKTDDGGYAVAGITTSIRGGQKDYCLLKLDENCDSLWMRTYGGEGIDECNDVIETSNGGFALAGQTTMILNAPTSFWVIFLDENGDSLRSFVRNYPNTSYSACNSIVELSDGKFIISGYLYNNYPEFTNHSRVWTIGIDSEARYIWSRIDGGEIHQAGYITKTSVKLSDTSIAITGGYYLSPEFGSPDGKLWLLEVTTTGNGRYILDENWEFPFGGFSILLTSSQEISVAGFIATHHANRDIIGMIYNTTEIPNSVNRNYQKNTVDVCDILVYPNPFNESTSIVLPTDRNLREFSAVIVDGLGRVVNLSDVAILNLTTMHWSPLGLPNGDYFLSISWDGYSIQKRITLIK